MRKSLGQTTLGGGETRDGMVGGQQRVLWFSQPGEGGLGIMVSKVGRVRTLVSQATVRCE